MADQATIATGTYDPFMSERVGAVPRFGESIALIAGQRFPFFFLGEKGRECVLHRNA